MKLTQQKLKEGKMDELEEKLKRIAFLKTD